jgi:hypothetical protein
MLGLPTVALVDVPEHDPVHIFQTGSPGLDARSVATTREKFAVAVRRLVVDPELRRRDGAAARAAVLAAHDGPGWRARLESLYAQARSLPAVEVEEVGESGTDDRFSAMLISALSPGTISPSPVQLAGPLGNLFDPAMQADLFVAAQRDAVTSLTLRVGAGWERERAWTTRVLALAADHPRLTVSLPFIANDDVHGTRSSAQLVAMLHELGQSPEDCGEIRVEISAPPVVLDIPFSAAALDWLHGVLVSPCWEPLRSPTLVGAPAVEAPAGD